MSILWKTLHNPTQAACSLHRLARSVSPRILPHSHRAGSRSSGKASARNACRKAATDIANRNPFPSVFLRLQHNAKGLSGKQRRAAKTASLCALTLRAAGKPLP